MQSLCAQFGSLNVQRRHLAFKSNVASVQQLAGEKWPAKPWRQDAAASHASLSSSKTIWMIHCAVDGAMARL